MGCRATKGWAIGYLLETKEDSKVIKVIHTWYGAPKETLQSYYHIDTIMTVAARKQISKNIQ